MRLAGANILLAAALIGATTLALSLLGYRLGRVAGKRFGRAAAIAGGIVLIGLGIVALVKGYL